MPHNNPDHPRYRRGEQPRPAPEHRADVGSWQQVLDTLREAGVKAGADAADWWAQDTIGARASGDVTARAATILAGIDDGDPRILDALPALHLPGAAAHTPAPADLYADATPATAPAWEVLDAEHHAEAIDAFRDGYDTGVCDRVVEHCTTALPDRNTDPTGGRHPRHRAA